MSNRFTFKQFTQNVSKKIYKKGSMSTIQIDKTSPTLRL